MSGTLKHLLPGLGFILLAALVLLVSERLQEGPVKGEQPKVAIFQFASRPVLDDCVAGALSALKAQGFLPDRDIEIRFFNAENDLATANAMARAILQEGVRLVITFSSPCLQVMANVNQEGKIIHIFGAVTDPFAAGVGISKGRHPGHLAGFGTFQPVRETFQLAKQLNPRLRSMGTVWNPGDAAAEACVALARDECRILGITLREAQVAASSEVAEAALSLTAQGVQALWVGGDNTVELAVESLVKTAKQVRIPVFCNAPTHLQAGAFCALGADYREVGRLTGDLAARVLKGLDPATVAVENVVPRQLGFNLSALHGMKEQWQPDLRLQTAAAILIDSAGRLLRSPARRKVTDSPTSALTEAGEVMAPPTGPAAKASSTISRGNTGNPETTH